MPAVKPEKRLVSKQDCALALGVSRPALDRYIKAGLPVVSAPATNRKQGFLIDLDAAQRWYGGLQHQRESQKPSREVVIFEAAWKRWWTLCHGLMSPENLSLVRGNCRTLEDLIRTARQLSRKAARELEAMIERMEAAE